MDEKEHNATAFGVPARRQEVIEILNQVYSRNFIELDEFEKRVEAVEYAGTLEELDKIIADIPVDFIEKNRQAGVYNFSAELPPFLVFNTKTIAGTALINIPLTFKTVWSTLTLDFRNTPLLPGITEVDFNAVKSTLEIIVPPGMIIENTCKEIRSSVWFHKRFNNMQKTNPAEIHVTGKLIMSTLSLRVKDV